MAIRTRFAPSPTGYLHLGGVRTALFCWAYARKFGGTFVLRIEDTDVERSTHASVATILDGLTWLGLNWDEGPIYQTLRLARYKEVARTLIENGHAYPCYASREEVEAMREQQRALGLKPRYDGRWRPESGKQLPPPPAGVRPVLRFKNPQEGVASWDDAVKGHVSFDNRELDDLVLVREDGMPTYNFGVVVDDMDMKITHVIRGDDHVNNTPRQINLYRALGVQPPVFCHLPMILGDDGARLSKRHGAVSVLEYKEAGYLPAGMINYLARLGWSHGDKEIFSLDQFVQWFDLQHITKSAAHFDLKKLHWVNGQHLRKMDLGELQRLCATRLNKADEVLHIPKALELYRQRTGTLKELTDALNALVNPPQASIPPEAKPALATLAEKLKPAAWEKEALGQALKETLAIENIKMPQLAIPLRLLLTGASQTPAIESLLEIFHKDMVLTKLQSAL